MSQNAIIFISKLTPILFHSKYSTCKKITIPFTHYFHNCTKMLFVLIMFFLSELYCRGFQRLCGKYNSIAFSSSWNMCLCIWKISQFWMIKSQTFPRVLKVELTYDPEIILLVLYPREVKTCKYKNIYMNFHSSLFHDSQRWKQFKCPSSNKWIH